VKKCKCCEDKRQGISGTGNGYGFNHLDGDDRQWAQDKGFVKSEYCVVVKGGKKFGGPDWIKTKCGDGRMGFSTRRKGQEDSSIEVGLDGQFKKKKHTLVKSKSAKSISSRRARRVDGSKCGLIPSVSLQQAMRNPDEVREQRELYQKMNSLTKRGQTNKNKSRRAVRRSRKQIEEA